MNDRRVAHADPMTDRALAALLSLAIACAGRLPIDFVVAAGAGLGRLWFRLRGPRSRRVCEQLARALPELEARRIRGLAERVFVHLGRGLAELLVLGGRHAGPLLERVDVEGFEHLAAARARSPTGAVLVLSAHFGNWELGGVKLASLGHPVAFVHRSRGRASLDSALRRIRDRAGGPEADTEQLPMGEAGLGMLRALRRGRDVVLLLDQDAHREAGVFTTFFGQPAWTRSGPAQLATRLGVPVVPMFIRRAEDGRRHRARIHPALQLEIGRPDEEGVIRQQVAMMTAAIEAEIRQCPEQWIWTHRRWRTRSHGPSRGTGES